MCQWHITDLIKMKSRKKTIYGLKAFEIIQRYGFNKICFVGRPNPVMTYFRCDINVY